MVDPKKAAKIFLKYNYPIWNTLEENIPDEMWEELGRVYGLKAVCGAEL